MSVETWFIIVVVLLILATVYIVITGSRAVKRELQDFDQWVNDKRKREGK